MEDFFKSPPFFSFGRAGYAVGVRFQVRGR